PGIDWQVDESDDLPQLVLTVQPGDPVRIRSREVRIEGAAGSDPDFLPELPEQPAQGDILHHGQYNSLRQAIRSSTLRLGYFDGEFVTREVKVDPAAGTADILLVFRSGERYRLGKVT